MTKPIVVIGLGNRWRTDDGVGGAVLEVLQAELGDLPSVEWIDAGAASLAALHAMAGRRAALLIDCAWMDTPPGTLRCMTPEEVVSRKVTSAVSGHDGDLLSVVTLARRLGACPETVWLIGIQPFSLEAGAQLSPALQQRLPDYVRAVRVALERLIAARRSP